MRLLFYALFVLSVLIFYTNATLSKQKKSKEKKKKESPQRYNVLERGLVSEEVTATDITSNHDKYSEREKDQRNFDTGETLAYVTPWNSHGYEIAKTFGKFSMVSPVWFQIKRKPRGMYNLKGTHDIDKAWLKELQQKSNPPKLVPRVIFDGWTDEDYKSLFQNEDEIERMTNTIINELTTNHMHGAVIEIWSQAGNTYPKEVIHVMKHMAEIFHEKNLIIILVIPPGLNKGGKLGSTFLDTELAELAPVVDYFSLMTYDFAALSGHAGPSAPLPWIKSCITAIDPDMKYRKKILMGLNFYGSMFTSKGSSPIVGNQYLEFLKLYSPEVAWEKSASEHYSQFGDDVSGKGLVFFPSLKSIDDRIKLAQEMGTGLSIWEIGQGLDYFYDLL